jgi:hypothetical protein
VRLRPAPPVRLISALPLHDVLYEKSARNYRTNFQY